MEQRVVAIVVTYNRMNLLKENINSLLNQTTPLDVLVIDNGSTDGTKKMISELKSERIIYINTGENLGGAGGFAIGIKKATELNYSYAWIMDDDTIPTSNALENLLKDMEGIEFSFLASMVYWSDGRVFPMNRPTIEKVKDIHISTMNKIKSIPIESCSFVGCLINIKYVWKVGLPFSEFFIYGDDVEYTRRLRKCAPAYWIIDSKIIHKAPSIEGADIALADASRISRFYYQTRNGIYLAKQERTIISLTKILYKLISRFFRILKYSKDNKFKRINVLFKGFVYGIFFNPQVKFPDNK